MKKRKGTNKPDIKRDKQVLELRAKNLTFRQIGKLTNQDVKNVFLRYRRAGGELLGNLKINKVPSNKYNSIHQANLRKRGTANHCDNIQCLNKSDIFDWALKHGKEHSRNPDNYYSLCRKCHHNYDFRKIDILTHI